MKTAKGYQDEVSLLTLQGIADVLNDGSQASTQVDETAHNRLVDLVTRWLESGPDIRKMHRRATDPNFWQIASTWEGRLTFVAEGGAQMLPVPGKDADIVSVYFIQLLLNPERLRLNAPCKQCCRWFIKQQKGRQTVYCSKTCKSNALVGNKRRNDRKKKLEEIGDAIANYLDSSSQLRSKMKWQEYVEQAVDDVTPNFLTRAVKAGEIQPPI
ncbi:hypothetical protein [Edaphobacter dinghuensis]|uniref:Uncharacterized protein n=1 Tax=Edaphobacter dinghuensis TaxID=1560005 RepID=A0A917H9K7_9BACT|nr:hypothetical protein [Edaphobacter dinghuensis]GGG72009.1 hypothetical protein GCM10011585_12860 [Edaphobacter dinghuensis]